MLGSCLCDYGVAYILVKGTITVSTATQDQANNTVNKSFAPFSNCIGRINNA